jgi:O-glycosyl hydrolase
LELRARVPGFQPEPGKWDWQADANQRWMLRAAVVRGANHVVAFANSPPFWMTVSGSVTGSTNGLDNNLRSDCEKPFADYIATVVSNLTVLDGVKFDTVTPMNEPSAAWWKLGGRQEGTHMSPDQQARMIGLLHAALDRSGVAAGLVASEDNAEQDTWRCLTSYDAVTLGLISRIATHTYNANDSVRLRSLAQTVCKPLWVSEYGDSERSGLTLARRIRDDIAIKRASAWIYWQFADSGGWGLVDSPSNGRDFACRLTRKFHVMAQFSRFIRPGFQILQASDNDSLAAYDGTNHQLIIVTVNDSFDPRTSVINLTGFTSTGTRALGHRTSIGENEAALAPVPIQAGHFTNEIPARSVTTFVIPEVFSKPMAH